VRGPSPPKLKLAPSPAAPEVQRANPHVNNGVHAPSKGKEVRPKETEEDRALVVKAQAGDMGAFRLLVERNQRRGFVLALALVRDENDARDIVQEAFVRVFKSLDSFQGGSSFYTWLYRIITNLSIDWMRKPGRRTAELDDDRLGGGESDDTDPPFLSAPGGANPIDVIGRREIASRLQAALDGLPSYHRAVVVLREVDGLSYEEMAEAMGVSKGTIMSRLFHARQKLQRALSDCYEEHVGGSSAAPPAVAETGGEP